MSEMILHWFKKNPWTWVEHYYMKLPKQTKITFNCYVHLQYFLVIFSIIRFTSNATDKGNLITFVQVSMLQSKLKT